jgi:putative bacteriocin precursor
MKKLVKPVEVETMAVIAYDNENCGGNCGCTSGSSGNSAAWIGAGATIVAACIAALCT